MIRNIMTGLGALLLAAVLGVLAWLFIAPPELLRVGDGYAAKMVCSNVFLAGRDAQQVLAVDVQAPGNPALKLISVKVDRKAHSVTARFLGLFAPSGALYRDGLGCTSVPDLNWAAAQAIHLPAKPVIIPHGPGLWPEGSDAPAGAAPELAAVFNDAKLTGPNMRAIVVIKDGRLLAETYGPGFTADTPLLGWSMSKTVNAALLGRVVQAGKLSLDDTALFPQWTDGRKDIRIRDLTAMKSGLAFNEDYGDVSDVSRMLYVKPDMAAFAADKPLSTTPGAHFAYSTGTSFILARLWMDRIGDPATALAFPRQALFGPLGMTSATMETDEHGTFAGGSYVYATARDWARFGQFLMQDGVWNGQRLLPEGFVGLMRTSNGSKDGYSQMQTWLLGPQESETGATGLPADAFWLRGHDGQTVTIIPSLKLIVIRMGLTPWEMGYRPEPLVKAVIHATR
ncbi:MAG: serine hydrolase [Asticcacaulis sp.]|uniref:serine hydrolase domain-containing protein n=1 Tax=Asticcacaulis sp. TaxID=1872648 RepID=UPI0039E5CAE8